MEAHRLGRPFPHVHGKVRGHVVVRLVAVYQGIAVCGEQLAAIVVDLPGGCPFAASSSGSVKRVPFAVVVAPTYPQAVTMPWDLGSRDSVSPLKKDYVVEQGTESGWQYVKWASGRAECSRAVETAITQTGTFWLPSITLPFAFKKTANSRSGFNVLVTGGDYFAPVFYLAYPITESTVTTIKCGAMYVTEKGSTTINYLVRGWWK